MARVPAGLCNCKLLSQARNIDLTAPVTGCAIIMTPTLNNFHSFDIINVRADPGLRLICTAVGKALCLFLEIGIRRPAYRRFW